MSRMKMRGLEESLVSIHSKTYALGGQNFVIKESRLNFCIRVHVHVNLQFKLDVSPAHRD